jgi:hypothetical protein
MVRYLLDTDTWSYAIRERPAVVRERMNAVPTVETWAEGAQPTSACPAAG